MTESELILHIGKTLQAFRYGTTEDIEQCLAGSSLDSIEDPELRDSFDKIVSFFDSYYHAKQFAFNLSHGNLEYDFPKNKSELGAFKGLQSTLKHLLWQVKRLAQGDYYQQVDYLGEFSVEFNTLITSLREKSEIEESLRQREQQIILLLEELSQKQQFLEARNKELQEVKEVTDHAFRKFQDLYDYAPTGYFSLSMQGEIMKLNYAFAEILNQTRSTLLGHDFYNFVAPECKRAFEMFVSEIDDIEKSHIEIEVVRKDLPRAELHLEAVLGDHEGEIFITAIDITSRKQTERRLSGLLSVLENSDNIIVQKDLDLKIIAANRRLAEIAGYENPDELIGKTDAEIFGVSPDTEPIRSYMRDELIAQSLDKGAVIEREEIVKSKDGAQMTVFTRKYPIFDTNNVLIGTGNISIDISNLKKAEEVRRQSEERFRLLFETMQQGVIFQNADGKIMAANPAVERILGHPKDTTIGRDSNDEIWGSIREDGTEFHGDEHPAMISLKSGKIVKNVVMGVYNYDKQDYVWINITSIPIFKGSLQEVDQVYAIFEDITERRRTEMELNDTMHELSCLSSIRNMMQSDFNSIQFFQYVADSIEAAMPYIHVSETKIEINNQIITSSTGTGDKENVITASIVVRNEKLGTISVSYEKKFQIFIPRKQELITNVASSISLFLENRSNILEKIEETEIRFRTLFLNAPIGIYRTTPDRGIVFANPRLLAMLGYNSLEELTQHQLNMDFYQDKNHGAEFLHTINTTEAVTDFETVWKTRLGRKIIVNENARVVKNHMGKIVFHDGIVEDVTERVESQRKLIESEIKYRTVADYTYDWEYWISPNGNIVFMSPSVEHITGYKISQFVDNPELLTSIIHPDDLHEWGNHVLVSHNPSLSDDHHDTTFRIISKDGNIRWISHVCRRIFVQEEYLGIRVSNRDTTDQIEAEKKLMNVTIEVEERERARYSRELHDGLGPLLSTIKLYFQWLSEYVQDDKGKIITQKGNQNIDLAIQTTREIAFNLSPRILENMGLQEALKVFIQNINDLQGIYIDFSSNSIERYDKNIEITIYRIVTELINNTIKYAHASKVVIYLESNKKKPSITLYYSDNGIGFDFKETEILKQGLGLKNLMQRVKTMRGVMNIDSQPGNGMQVTVVLPSQERL